jgi:hypothetical protein
MRSEIQRVDDANQQVYGVRKVWRQLARERITSPRCQVERLMRGWGYKGSCAVVARARRSRPISPSGQPTS